MPLLQINYSQKEIQQTAIEAIHHYGAQILSDTLSKSVQYCMVILNTKGSHSFAQDHTTPSAYLEVKNVGKLTPEITAKLSAMLTKMITEQLLVDPARIYIEFQESERHLWGWNGKTFV